MREPIHNLQPAVLAENQLKERGVISGAKQVLSMNRKMIMFTNKNRSQLTIFWRLVPKPPRGEPPLGLEVPMATTPQSEQTVKPRPRWQDPAVKT